MALDSASINSLANDYPNLTIDALNAKIETPNEFFNSFFLALTGFYDETLGSGGGQIVGSTDSGIIKRALTYNEFFRKIYKARDNVLQSHGLNLGVINLKDVCNKKFALMTPDEIKCVEIAIEIYRQLRGEGFTHNDLTIL